jgi:hypothetical protein
VEVKATINARSDTPYFSNVYFNRHEDIDQIRVCIISARALMKKGAAPAHCAAFSHSLRAQGLTQPGSNCFVTTRLGLNRSMDTPIVPNSTEPVWNEECSPASPHVLSLLLLIDCLFFLLKVPPEMDSWLRTTPLSQRGRDAQGQVCALAALHRGFTRASCRTSSNANI